MAYVKILLTFTQIKTCKLVNSIVLLFKTLETYLFKKFFFFEILLNFINYFIEV